MDIQIIANAAVGPGLSGGDRIFIECARRWSKKGHNIRIYTSEEGLKMCARNRLCDVKYVLWPAEPFTKMGLAVSFLTRTLTGIMHALNVKLSDNSVIYSASEFFPDLLPAWIIKLRNRNTKWIAAFYLFAPHPFSIESPYRGFSKIKNILYFSMQQISYRIVTKYADMVWVTNELDRWKFIDNKKLTADRVIAVYGGVDVKTPALIPEPKEKKFDAVFIGRFHPQKGVLELIDIWKYVCEKKKDAKLAMIGVGDLEREVKEKIRKYGLENNITLFGFKDGVEKLKIFKESKIVLYPAILDHWSMAPVEAMACGLPLVTFDLRTLTVLHPKGIVKVPCYDLNAFAAGIIGLLEDKKLYERLHKEALEFAGEWDWNKRANSLLESIMSLYQNMVS